jgi:hypothetical protein
METYAFFESRSTVLETRSVCRAVVMVTGKNNKKPSGSYNAFFEMLMNSRTLPLKIIEIVKNSLVMLE